MGERFYYNDLTSTMYMLKSGDVYFWHDERWRISAFKEINLTASEGLREL